MAGATTETATGRRQTRCARFVAAVVWASRAPHDPLSSRPPAAAAAAADSTDHHPLQTRRARTLVATAVRPAASRRRRRRLQGMSGHDVTTRRINTLHYTPGFDCIHVYVYSRVFIYYTGRAYIIIIIYEILYVFT